MFAFVLACRVSCCSHLEIPEKDRFWRRESSGKKNMKEIGLGGFCALSFDSFQQLFLNLLT